MNIITNMGISDLEKLDGFHNEVYFGIYKNDKLVIRVSKPQRREVNQIVAEIKFLELLKKDVNVIEPYYISGKSVFEKENRVISLFKYVNGPKWNELEHSDEIIFEAGRQLALIHKSSSECRISFNRDDYKEHTDIHLFNKNFPDKEFKKEYTEVINLIETSTTSEDYFLIHGDYLFSNIIYNQNLTVIDFDDCEYGYYQYDIAVYMFYYILGGNPDNMDIAQNRTRFKIFIDGYRSVRDIKELRIENLNPFFRLRQLKLMGTIAEYQGDIMGEWQKKFIRSSLDRIQNKKNFI